MKCSVCGRVSASKTHADCAERLRMETDGHDPKAIAESISLDGAEVGSEIRTLLNHMKRDDG